MSEKLANLEKKGGSTGNIKLNISNVLPFDSATEISFPFSRTTSQTYRGGAYIANVENYTSLSATVSNGCNFFLNGIKSDGTVIKDTNFHDSSLTYDVTNYVAVFFTATPRTSQPINMSVSVS